MSVELAGQVLGCTEVERVRAKDPTQRLAERALASAGIANEYGGSLRLLGGMLHGPSHPIESIAVNVIVACGQYFEDVLAQEAPIAGLRLDPPSLPQVELAVDDALVARPEDHAGILPPVAVMEPPFPYVDPVGFLFAADVDAPVEVQVAEVVEGQERRHLIDVVLAAGRILIILKPQHFGPRAVEHNTIFGVEFGQQLLGLAWLRRRWWWWW